MAGGNTSGANETSILRYAHSLEGRPVEEWQPLDIHLDEVAVRASKSAERFDSADWAWNAGLLHDVGKAADEFQAYLLRENGLDDPNYDANSGERVNHSSAGAAFAEERLDGPQLPLGRILAYLVAGHHAGLPDYHTCDSGLGALIKRLEEGRGDIDRIRAIAADLTKDFLPLERPPAFVSSKNCHLWMRMLFSCLVDADFLDTEAFMNAAQAEGRTRDSASIDKLKHALDQHMADLTARAADTTVNRVRREILDACRDVAGNAPGLFSLTVPTGGGKTLAAMSFALDHALKHDKRRVIYVIPYTSIIEQTAETLASIFGAENVVEHHSNLDPEKETQRTRLASENWDAPVIVTTNVQFFESLYSDRGSRCRKLHNLVDSVVILDEAQMLPPELLTPCVAVINELTRNYGVSLVLSTATQPALPDLDTATEITPPEMKLYERLQRTHYEFPALLNERSEWEEIADELVEHDQVLCIVNTRRDCHDLFRLMPEGTIHLSGLMCGQHRSEIIQSIKKRLDAREPLRVVTTQLVEAGVDIDFPVVYRALAGLDSIAQAAGRCNREGKLGQDGRVVVFVPPRASPRGLLRKGEDKTRELLALDDFDPQSPEWFTKYFDLFYNSVNDSGKSVIGRLTPDNDGAIAFRKVGREFRLIKDNDQRSIIVRYGKKVDALIEQLRYAGPSRDLMRHLQRYTVNLYQYQLAPMQEAGLIDEPYAGILAQTELSRYDSVIGLDVYGDTLNQETLIQ